MSIASIGQGYQLGDGNLNEIKIGTMPEPQTATATATLTAAQVLGGVLVGNPSASAATYTTPTAAAIETALPNLKVGSTFDLTVINLGTSSGIITFAGGTGVTLSGMATLPITTSAGSTGTWRFRKTATGAFTAYRIA